VLIIELLLFKMPLWFDYQSPQLTCPPSNNWYSKMGRWLLPFLARWCTDFIQEGTTVSAYNLASIVSRLNHHQYHQTQLGTATLKSLQLRACHETSLIPNNSPSSTVPLKVQVEVGPFTTSLDPVCRHVGYGPCLRVSLELWAHYVGQTLGRPSKVSCLGPG